MSLRTVKKTAESIRRLEIQGAKNIAKAAVKALKKVKETEYSEAAYILTEARPTEPMLRNILNYISHKMDEGYSLKESISFATDLMNASEKRIIEVGKEKIFNNYRILTHCHSSTVMSILKRAWAEGKRFEVFACEARPLYQGRITARELVKAGIPVTLIVDSAARYYMNDFDLVLVGGDAFTAEGYLVNKIGTSMIALAAHEALTEFATAIELLKYDPVTGKGKPEPIEERNPKEVWEKPPKNVRIKNPAFDVTPPDYIDFVITDAGITNPFNVQQLARENYPWMAK